MFVGIPKEIYPGEKRVAVTPQTVGRMIKLGLQVGVQAGAGSSANILDSAFAEAGAEIVPARDALFAASDVILKVRPPTFLADDPAGRHEADLFKEGSILIGFVWPGQNKELVERLAKRKMTVLGMDCMPRTTRAQKMDALSATANLAGYRAVVEAASHYGRFFTGQMTAAGRVKPAHVLVVGCGVAGLAAIATARSLGAVVRAFDTRPQVREQIESLGAQFVPFEFKGETGEGSGGYAKEVSDAYLAAEQALIGAQAKEMDVIITTALIPGKPAPQLVTSGAVVSMHHGSVIVDLSSEQGGNCALTERDRVVEKFGVTIIGYTDWASRMPLQASELYATTVVNLVEEVIPKGALALNLEDEVHRGVLVLHRGELKWPPPQRTPQRAGAPRPEAKRPAAAGPTHVAPAGKVAGIAMAAMAGMLGTAGLFAPPDFLQHLTVFLLACVVGWHVVWNVTPALHTPLMSVTNAISGIILIGGVVLMRGVGLGTPVLEALATLLAAVNVAGGFLVTRRMLRMFRR